MRWNELKRRTMTPAQRRKAERQARRAVAEINMRQLREALKITQKDLGARMKLTQVAVSRLERRKNLNIRTLASYLQALGGRLELRAIVPGRKPVTLSHFAAK
jgi:hypothetical protein